MVDILPGTLMREGMSMLAIVGAPLFMTLLVLGIAVGILQAATQINDPAIGFVPRMVASLGICWFFGTWMLENFSSFLGSAINAIAGAGP